MNIIGNNLQIIRRNASNELEVNGHAVTGSTLNQLYAALLLPKKS